MASKYWLKLYYEILDDPKTARLPDSSWRRFIECLVLAGEQDEGGLLPKTEDMAWRLRVSETTMQQDMARLALADLVQLTPTDDGDRWLVTNYAKRQAAVPGAERIKRYRDRERKNEYYNEPVTGGVTEDVTKGYTDIDIDKIREERDKTGAHGAQDATAAAGAVFDHIQNGLGLPMNKLLSDKVGDWIDEYPHQWIMEAIDEAILHNARNYKYVNAILTRWKAEGKGSRANGKDNELWQRIMDVTAAGKLADLQGAEREAARIVGPANLKGTSPEKFKARFLEEYHKCLTR